MINIVWGESADLLAIVLLLSMFLGPGTSGKRGTSNKEVNKILMMVIFFLLFDLIFQFNYGSDTKLVRMVLFYSKSAYFILNSLVTFTWAQYVGISIWEKDYSLKWYRSFYFYLLAVNIVMVIVNCFYPFVFTITDKGLFYAYPAGMWAFTLCNYTIAAIALVSLIRNRGSLQRSSFQLMLLYMLFPMSGEMIQIALKDVDLVSLYSISAFLLYRLEINQDSFRDPLTGLGNRHLLENRLKRWFTGSRRYYICGILLDIDRLKSINDKYGHTAGDSVITQVSEILSNLPDREIIATRYGGDEFVLVWQSVDGDDLKTVCDYLEHQEAEINRGRSKENQIHYSIGAMSCSPEEKLTASDFMWLIDKKMYEAKREIDAIIEDALKNGRVDVYFQPIWSVAEKRFTAAEALLRLWTEKGEFISPDVFIPAAEKSGAILTMGGMVAERVCRFIASDCYKESGLEHVEVNLSLVQCRQENVTEKILHGMEKYNVQRNQVRFEITETALSYYIDEIRHNLEQMYKAGLFLTVDDFGNGYSNLRRLINLPVSLVKLDRSLLQDYSEKTDGILRGIVSALKNVDLQLTIEGVETEEQFDRMKEIGVDYIQGFYLAYPMPEQNLRKFLKNEKLKREWNVPD